MIRALIIYLALGCLVSTAATPPYNRDDWSIWRTSHCLSTRESLLISTSQIPAVLGAKNCSVVSGLWIDPYTTKTYLTAISLDIDHLVPPAWAYERGALKWTKQQKGDFANDKDNLTPVGLSINRSKNDKGPMEWLPPNPNYQCTYITRFNNIVRKYHLRYKPGEGTWMTSHLKGCTSQFTVDQVASSGEVRI